MSTTFNIDYEWLSNGYGDAPEQVTLAELAINVGGYCVTEVEDTLAKTVRSSARLSALHLAEWFAANWWRLLWEPKLNTYSWRASHKVGNAGNGYVWPDLSFSSDWQSIDVVANPTPRWGAEPIRYLNSFETPIPIEDFEKGVENFIEGTIARLSSTSRDRSALGTLWHEVTKERRDDDVAQWRALEACMGYDPDEAPASLLENVQRQMIDYGECGVREVAAACRSYTTHHVNSLWDAAQEIGITVQVPRCDDIRQRLQREVNPSDVPWKRAEQTARLTREVWGLEVPIVNDRLEDLFHITEKQFSDERTNGQKPLMAGFRDDAAADRIRISWNSPYPTSRRFALARLVSDHIDAPQGDRLLPGTSSITKRQKFQRAFAQEFLCPFEALKEEIGTETPDSEDVQAAAEHFNVSPLMVQTTLVNKGVLERETLTNWVV